MRFREKSRSDWREERERETESIEGLKVMRVTNRSLSRHRQPYRSFDALFPRGIYRGHWIPLSLMKELRYRGSLIRYSDRIKRWAKKKKKKKIGSSVWVSRSIKYNYLNHFYFGKAINMFDVTVYKNLWLMQSSLYDFSM